jgi:hypothetical protein
MFYLLVKNTCCLHLQNKKIALSGRNHNKKIRPALVQIFATFIADSQHFCAAPAPGEKIDSVLAP